MSRELFNGGKLLLKLNNDIKSYPEVRNFDIYKYALLYSQRLMEPSATKYLIIFPHN